MRQHYELLVVKEVEHTVVNRLRLDAQLLDIISVVSTRKSFLCCGLCQNELGSRKCFLRMNISEAPDQ